MYMLYDMYIIRILASRYIFSKYGSLNLCAYALLYSWYIKMDHSISCILEVVEYTEYISAEG